MRDLEQLVCLLNERCRGTLPIRANRTREEWAELMWDFEQAELLSISTSDDGWGLVPQLIAAADLMLVTEQEWWV